MRVIGIDPGIAITGYGLVDELENGSLHMVDYGAILTSSKTPVEERLSQIFHSLNELLEQHKPQTSAVEKLFFQKNVRTAMTVGQARGVAMLSLSENNVSIAEYTPLEIKQAVTGYGSADKQQVQHMVRAMLNLDEIPKPDDAADALAVAICHLHSAKLRSLSDME